MANINGISEDIDSQGWIKIYREIRSHWIMEDAEYLKAWLLIILECNHKPKKALIDGELIDCGRGQSLHSLPSWAKIFGRSWSVQKVRTFFTLLEKDLMIKREGLRKTTRLTVVNYSTYQDSQQTANRQLTDRQQTDNIEQECKECKEEESKSHSAADAPEVVDFDPVIDQPEDLEKPEDLNEIGKRTETALESAISIEHYQVPKNEKIVDCGTNDPQKNEGGAGCEIGKPEKPKNRVKNSSERGLKFAAWFRTLVPSSQEITESVLNSWGLAYDELEGLDMRSDRDICEVCKWARADDFWKDNFLSPVKLRKKDKSGTKYFDVFLQRMVSEREKKQNGTQGNNHGNGNGKTKPHFSFDNTRKLFEQRSASSGFAEQQSGCGEGADVGQGEIRIAAQSKDVGFRFGSKIIS